ncbi:MAG: PD-(D/E)XK nuclease family protein, partial [Gemmatimonadota bacterium]|nr:PD-(D/E)XK nuclease family protein [Gemmatimonadota bacterium]
AGGARPAYHELAFGEQADGAGRRDAASVAEAFPLVVATSQGERTVYFRGSVDRVDVFETGGRRYGVAIDYKTGRTSSHYAKEMLAGHDLQLRLYLLALERFWGIVPAGALYLGFGDGVRRGAVRADLEPFIPGLGSTAEVKRLEPTDWDHFVRVDTPERIATLVDRLVRRDITAAPNCNDCGFCNLRSICRYDRFAGEPVHV